MTARKMRRRSHLSRSPIGNYAGTASQTKIGWTAGAGAEYAFARNWSVKLEYLFVDLGSTSVLMFGPTRPG
jgi:outer membrane immunogenic protein